MADDEKIGELAAELSKALERKERERGNHEPGLSSYTTLRDGSPQWMTDVCHAAHDDGAMLPDDWRYEFIDDAATALAEAEGDLDSAQEALDESEHYCYTAQQTGWLHSRNSRYAYVDAAHEEYSGDVRTVLDAIRLGMLAEQCEVLQQVYDALAEVADDMEDGDDDGEPVAEAVSA